MINAKQNDIIFTIYHKMRISNDKLENRNKMTDRLITSLLQRTDTLIEDKTSL